MPDSAGIGAGAEIAQPLLVEISGRRACQGLRFRHFSLFEGDFGEQPSAVGKISLVFQLNAQREVFFRYFQCFTELILCLENGCFREKSKSQISAVAGTLGQSYALGGKVGGGPDVA